MQMIQRQIALISVLSIFLFSSCTKILDDELPENKPKLVVNGLINTDSVLKVNISKTIHIFANENNNNAPFIKGAATKFYRDGEFLFNLEEDENGYYSKPGFHPSLNHRYRIEVEKAGYKTIKAETLIPNPVGILSFDTVHESESNGDYYGNKIKCKLKYLDPAGVENYYRLDCFLLFIDEQGNEDMYRQSVYVDENNEYFFDKTYNYLLWSDPLSDGNEVTIDFIINMDNYGYSENNETVIMTYLILLNSVSEDFYKYDKTCSLYFESGGSGDPFSEPVLIHSNITDGYGVFGGFSNDTVSFQYSFNY
jgi:hypothetical protein